eukprot:364568-Chlamydomonas_euryale.AAC.21
MKGLRKLGCREIISTIKWGEREADFVEKWLFTCYGDTVARGLLGSVTLLNMTLLQLPRLHVTLLDALDACPLAFTIILALALVTAPSCPRSVPRAVPAAFVQL